MADGGGRRFRRIAVYCGGSNDAPAPYYEVAREVGRTLAQRGIAVVYGGGAVGMMGALADAALDAGGEVLGVIPRRLLDLELGHPRLTEQFVVDSMHTRKSMMMHLSDAFLTLPGGYGTLEEVFEAVTWAQLNYHMKPVGLLNVEGYYDHLLQFVDHASQVGFVRPVLRDLLVARDGVPELLEALERAEIPVLESWARAPVRS